MKVLINIIFGLTLIGCQTANDFDYYYFELNDGFPVSSELQLSDNGTFKITELDFHAGMGGVDNGNFKWEKDLLILNYDNSKTRILIQNLDKLYRIEEYDSLVADNIRFQSSIEIIEIGKIELLKSFSRPARTNMEA